MCPHNINKYIFQLKSDPSLKDLQKYVARAAKQRGFDKESVAEKFMLFLEECGELAKAARKTQKVKIDKNSKNFDLGEKMADVFFYLLDICNKFNIDLEEAFGKKEETNKKRSWE